MHTRLRRGHYVSGVTVSCPIKDIATSTGELRELPECAVRQGRVR
jgi:hypothetical protein